MSSVVDLNINGESVTLKFGYGLFRLLGEKWNLPGINSVFMKFSCFEKAQEEITFEMMELLIDLVVYSGLMADASVELDRDEIADCLIQNPGIITQIMGAFMDSIPKNVNVDPAGKRSPAKPRK